MRAPQLVCGALAVAVAVVIGTGVGAQSAAQTPAGSPASPVSAGPGTNGGKNGTAPKAASGQPAYRTGYYGPNGAYVTVVQQSTNTGEWH